MRNLTIKRTKRYAACLAKMKVYIEDPASGEITINGVTCRKLGELKNGEQKAFQIPDNEAKVFVIADKVSRNYYNDFYQLPNGTEDIFLTGENKLNPTTGNAFIFDNNPNSSAAENRKKGSRIGWVIIAAGAILGVIVGRSCSSAVLSDLTSQDKEFSHSGMSITLTGSFREAEAEGYTVAYESRNVAVIALKESFTLLDGLEDYTIDQYAQIVLTFNGMDTSELKSEDGLTYFEFEYTNGDESYHYFVYLYKADDAFWSIQFCVLKENAGEYAKQITQWAESVEFK